MTPLTISAIERELDRLGLWLSWTSQVELTGRPGRYQKKFTWITRIQCKNQVIPGTEIRRDNLNAAKRASFEALKAKRP